MSQLNRSTRAVKRPPKNEEDSLSEDQICAAVNRILCLDQSKKAFKQSDVLSCLERKIPRKLTRQFFETVKERLEELGLSLHIDDCGLPTMILSSCEKPKSFMENFASDEEKADRTLLILVLSLIFMKEGSVTEDEVFKFLKTLQIMKETSTCHEYFGEVAQKIQGQFVEELYIKRTAADNGQVELGWGLRAEIEVSKKDVLDFVCKVGYAGEREPQHFVTQFKLAEEQEQNLGDSNEEGSEEGEVSEDEDST